VTTADRRLDVLTAGLTARERAILAIGCWIRGEEPDERLIKYMPPGQKEEFERLVTAVENANDEFWSDCSIWCEWIHQSDIELAWLESISALFARQAKLLAALKVQGVAVREEAKAARRSSRQALIRSTTEPIRESCSRTSSSRATSRGTSVPLQSWRALELLKCSSPSSMPGRA
jgi:hypothetical protein